jgi:integrase
MRTVNEILDRYERDYLPGLAERSRKDYARHIVVLRSEFGERDAEKLVASDFDEFMNVDKGKFQRTRILAVLSSAFTQAVWWTWLPHNVCMLVARPRGKPRDRYITTDEFEEFKAFISRRGGPTRLGLAMDIALYTGMTQGEILDLRWADVNSVERTITYWQAATDKSLTIPITSRLRALLDECRSLKGQGDYVLPQRSGQRYTGEGFRAVFQRYMRKWQAAKHERFTFQDIHSKWEYDRLGTSVVTEVQTLIARGSESPGVELKQWMSLSDPVVRANLARHLAALANYGGGYLIFGLLKDGTLDTNHPGDLSQFNNDEIAGIVDRFLDPPFHCDVSIVQPSDGRDSCAVVRVPSHGSVPVCAKADGPHNTKGKPQGITMGRYYIRVNGPKSDPIETPEQWGPLIRRCVLNERRFLLDSIASLLGPDSSVPEPMPPERNQKVVRSGSASSGRVRTRLGMRRKDTRRV